MCNMITIKPARKTRSKTRRPKFLSLRLELTPENSHHPLEKMIHYRRRNRHRHSQLNLFPLHPENLLDDVRDAHDDQVAYFFQTADVGGGATLSGLLTGGEGEDGSAAEESLSPSLTCAYGSSAQDSEEGADSLVRAALRSNYKERERRSEEEEGEEEKWVVYTEVVERKEEEVTSCSAADEWCQTPGTSLLLKLDYQGIMNAWSDKGPLYIENRGPEAVPELHDDHHGAAGLMDGLERGAWSVPEKEAKVAWKVGQREASVLRYKEKRQNRLFSKRIRYEVRKLNAEKRPRMKGRFVKRS